MNKKIYVSEFVADADSTKRQKALFEADLKYAISRGYQYLQDAEGNTFTIISESVLGLLPGNTPEEVDALIEDYENFKANYSGEDQDECDSCQESNIVIPTPEEVSDLLNNIFPTEEDPDDDASDITDYTIEDLQSKLNQIIGNTLELAEPIQPQRADTLLKLVDLKLKLQECKA